MDKIILKIELTVNLRALDFFLKKNLFFLISHHCPHKTQKQYNIIKKSEKRKSKSEMTEKSRKKSKKKKVCWKVGGRFSLLVTHIIILYNIIIRYH